jgi:hypothetical protein
LIRLYLPSLVVTNGSCHPALALTFPGILLTLQRLHRLSSQARMVETSPPLQASTFPTSQMCFQMDQKRRRKSHKMNWLAGFPAEAYAWLYTVSNFVRHSVLPSHNWTDTMPGSIIDTNAHDVPIYLRKKWINRAHIRSRSGDRNASPSIALCKISEVNSSFGPEEAALKLGHAEPPKTPEPVSIAAPENRSSGESSASDTVSKAPGGGSPLGKLQSGGKIAKLVSKLSRAGLTEKRNPERGAGIVKQGDHDNLENQSLTEPHTTTASSPVKKMTTTAKLVGAFGLGAPSVE